MTNRELIDAAWAELMTSDISGKVWLDRKVNGYKGRPYNWQNTAYGRALALLNQVTNTPAPPPPPPPPPPSGSPTLARPFAADDPFNTPIVNPVVSPDSDAQIAWLIANALNAFGPVGSSVPSIWVATASTPRVTVVRNFPSVCAASYYYNVPIDPSWKPGNGGMFTDTESAMIVRDADNGDEWSFYQLTAPWVPPLYSPGGPTSCPATAMWASTRVERTSWKGYSGTGPSISGSEVALGAGVIRPEETLLPAGSDWGHALAMSYPNTRAGGFVYPAHFSDGTHTGPTSIPEGAKFWLPPGFDIEASGLFEWQKQMCRTIRKYGMFVVDTGAGIKTEGLASVRARGLRYKWEDEGITTWDKLPLSVLSHFKVLYGERQPQRLADALGCG